MTLNQLRAFIGAFRSGSFTAAAADLGVSQAAVSELVRRMEEDFGVPLFTRGSRRLVLTSAGNELLPYAERTVGAADAGVRALSRLRNLAGGSATFGMLRNADYYLLTDLAEAFHSQHPNVQLRLVGVNSAEVAAGVSRGALEAGVVVLPVDEEGLSTTPWMRDEVLVATRDPHRYGQHVTIAQLAASDLILYDAHSGWKDPTRRQLGERAQREGVKLEPMIEVEHVEAALNLTARGLGDTIVSAAVANGPAMPPDVVTLPFSEPLFDTIALIHRESAVLSPATEELARLAHEMLSVGFETTAPQVPAMAPTGSGDA